MPHSAKSASHATQTSAQRCYPPGPRRKWRERPSSTGMLAADCSLLVTSRLMMQSKLRHESRPPNLHIKCGLIVALAAGLALGACASSSPTSSSPPPSSSSRYARAGQRAGPQQFGPARAHAGRKKDHRQRHRSLAPRRGDGAVPMAEDSGRAGWPGQLLRHGERQKPIRPPIMAAKPISSPLRSQTARFRPPWSVSSPAARTSRSFATCARNTISTPTRADSAYPCSARAACDGFIVPAARRRAQI